LPHVFFLLILHVYFNDSLNVYLFYVINEKMSEYALKWEHGDDAHENGAQMVSIICLSITFVMLRFKLIGLS
jgi:hypothetical protein